MFNIDNFLKCATGKIPSQWVNPSEWDTILDDDNLKEDTLNFSEQFNENSKIENNDIQYIFSPISRINVNTSIWYKYKIPYKDFHSVYIVLPLLLWESISEGQGSIKIGVFMNMQITNEMDLLSHRCLCEIIDRHALFIEDSVHVPIYFAEAFRKKIFPGGLIKYGEDILFDLFGILPFPIVSLAPNIYLYCSIKEQSQIELENLKNVNFDCSIIQSSWLGCFSSNQWFLCSAGLVIQAILISRKSERFKIEDNLIDIVQLDISVTKDPSPENILSIPSEKFVKIHNKTKSRLLGWIIPLSPDTTSMKRIRQWFNGKDICEKYIGINFSRLENLYFRLVTEGNCGTVFSYVLLSRNYACFTEGLMGFLYVD